jgi:hypothetical protein
MTNPEIGGIFRDMELAIIKLMQDLEIITPEASNFMQQQSQFANNPNAPQMQYPGVPPGANPM